MVSKLINIFSILIALGAATHCHAELADDQAFRLDIKVVNNNHLEFKWEIAPQHYLYQTQIVILNNENKSLFSGINFTVFKLLSEKVMAFLNKSLGKLCKEIYK